MTTIYLTEDNAGKLTVGNDDAGWYLVDPNIGMFDDDCRSYEMGDADDWHTERYDTQPADIVAEWTDGEMRYTGRPGLAARHYTGMSVDWQ